MQHLDVFLTPLQLQRLKRECPVFRDGKQEEINKLLKALMRREIILAYVDVRITNLVHAEMLVNWKTEFKLWGDQIKVGQIECDDKLLEKYGELEKKLTGTNHRGSILSVIVAEELKKLTPKDYEGYGIRVTKAGKVKWETDLLESFDSCVKDIILDGFSTADDYERDEFIDDELREMYWSIEDFMYLGEMSTNSGDSIDIGQEDYEEFHEYVDKAFEGLQLDINTNLMVIKHILRKVEELACADGIRKDYSDFYRFILEQKKKDIMAEE